jgi:cytochrome P450
VPLTPSAPSPSDERIGQLDHDLRMLLSTFAAAVFLSPAPKIVPFRGRATLPAAWRRLSRWIDEQIENRLANPIEHVDMLQVLLDARDEDGEPLSRQDLIAGGYETVVASASWTLALLGTNPEALQRLIDEVDTLEGAPPQYADLNRLTWVKACFDEGQ